MPRELARDDPARRWRSRRRGGAGDGFSASGRRAASASRGAGRGRVSYRARVELLLILAGGLFLTSLFGGSFRARHRAAITGGARVRAELDAAYTGDHEYAPAELESFPDADPEFYRHASRAFEAQGFTRVADLEDLTLSRIHPDSRTMLRLFVDDGRMIRATAYHVAPKSALVAMMQIVRISARPLYILELVSELPRGRFLSTSNTAGLITLEQPPQLRTERLPPDAKLVALIERHRARLTEALRRDPVASPVTLEGRDQVRESLQRYNRLIGAWRAAQRGLSREELERLRGRPLDELDEAFLAEVQRDKPRGD